MIYLLQHLVEAGSKQPIEETQAPLECPIFMEKYNSLISSFWYIYTFDLLFGTAFF